MQDHTACKPHKPFHKLDMRTCYNMETKGEVVSYKNYFTINSIPDKHELKIIYIY